MEIARVIEIRGKNAVIKPEFTAGCEKCELKSLCIGNKKGTLLALNEAGAKEGDLVEFEIKLTALNITLMLLAGAGMVALLLGVIVGYYLNPFSIDPALSGGLLGLFLSLITLFLLRNRGRKKELYPRIKRILKEVENG